MFYGRKILVLAPHTDDWELGCGGLIARFRKRAQIYIHIFSTAKESIPSGFDRDITEREAKRVLDLYEIPQDRYQINEIPVRRFPSHRQEILELMIEDRRLIKPDVVLFPHVKDTHQDHHVISVEGWRAFKGGSVAEYELPWNSKQADLNLFCHIPEECFEFKLRAVDIYLSQRQKKYMDPVYIRAWANFRGTEIDVPLAEAFRIVQWKG